VLPLLLSAAGVAAASGAAALAYATQVEPFWLRTRRIELVLCGLHEDLDGLTILHLSDIHAKPGDRRGAVNVRRASRIEADVVCITGDFGDIPPHAPLAADLLACARGRLGTFAVLGNHDYDATPYRRPHRFDDDVGFAVGAALEADGVMVLQNESVSIPVGRTRLWFVGLDDPHTFRDDVSRAYCGVPANEPSIVLAHSWEPTVDVGKRGARLLLSGHTHGGQVRLPFMEPPLHQTFRRPPKVGGFQWVDGVGLHISPGLGGTHHLRFMVRPEATLFTLRRR
jgi:hypothetical protein